MDIDKLKTILNDTEYYRITIEKTISNNLNTISSTIEENKVTKLISIFYIKNKRPFFYTTNKKEFKFKLNDAKKGNYNVKYIDDANKDKVTIGQKSDLNIYDLKQEIDKVKNNNLNFQISLIEKNKKIITEFSEIEQTFFYNMIYANYTKTTGTKLRQVFKNKATTKNIDKEIDEIIHYNYTSKYHELLKYKESIKGKYDIILAPKAAYVFIHEAIGHALESDIVKEENSILTLNKNLQNRKINIFDDPTIPKLNGSYLYDDEGIKARKKHLIKNGIVNDYIFNQEYAQEFNTNSNAGARAENAAHIPIPRMSNTYLEPGDTTLKELIENTKKAILINYTTGGQTNPTTGIYQFGIKELLLIENGEIKEKYYQSQLSGNILNSLKEIKEITQDTEEAYGFCGKSGQTVPVGANHPYVYIKNQKLM